HDGREVPARVIGVVDVLGARHATVRHDVDDAGLVIDNPGLEARGVGFEGIDGSRPSTVTYEDPDIAVAVGSTIHIRCCGDVGHGELAARAEGHGRAPVVAQLGGSLKA